MSIQPGAALYTQGFGTRPENVEVPVISTVSPGPNFYNYPIGKRWINSVANIEYTLTSISTIGGVSNAIWTTLGTVAGPIDTLTDGSSTVVTPVASNIQIAGTAGQIVSTAGSGKITLSLPAAITTPGSLTTTTSLTVTTNATVGGTLGVTGLSTLGALTQVGTTNINTSGAAVTNIGTGGTGAVNIGNITGSTTISGSLTTTGQITSILGNITATAGNVVVSTPGDGLVLPVTVTAGGASIGTCNGRVGSITFSSSIPADSAEALTINNSAITGSGTVILYTIVGANVGASLNVSSIANAAGMSIVTVSNSGGTAQSNPFTLTFIVLN
jgi:hypothetical protein